MEGEDSKPVSFTTAGGKKVDFKAKAKPRPKKVGGGNARDAAGGGGQPPTRAQPARAERAQRANAGDWAHGGVSLK